jgi:hypothetical protein
MGIRSVGLYNTLVPCLWKPTLLKINPRIIPCGTKMTITDRLLDTFCFHKYLLHFIKKMFQINVYWVCIGSSGSLQGLQVTVLQKAPYGAVLFKRLNEIFKQ